MRRSLLGGIAACLLTCVALIAGFGYASGWLANAPAVPDAAANHAEHEQAAPDADRSAAWQEGEGGKSPHGETSGTPAAHDSAPAVVGENTGGEGGAPAAHRPSATAPAAAGTPEPEPEPEPAPAATPSPEPAPATITVSVHVDSSRATPHGWPSCLASTAVTLPAGSSVYDALLATGVGVGGSSSYVSAIGGLAERACGSGSGWLYSVNGAMPSYSCGSYILNGGESICWIYTCDMGRDL